MNNKIKNMREIKFRALVEYAPFVILGKFWEYYETLSQPVWLDPFVAKIIVKDLQFTGLMDDNEKEIYDGDIVALLSGDKHSVEWNDDILRWQFSNGMPLNDGETYSCYKIIIGNIYENPELLHSDKNVKECDATGDANSYKAKDKRIK